MRATLASSLLAVAVVVAASSCGGARDGLRGAGAGALRQAGAGAAADPTVRGARLLPEEVDETITYGIEPGGGVRAITAALRVVASHDGSILAAADRLPQAPQLTTPLPDRLGGGFLFVLGATVWRADRWLGPVKPLFTTAPGQSILEIVPGLERVYVRTVGTYLAIDGKSGRMLDLGPWPASPFVSSYAAADGWRAAAITDLRGVVATSDAGATWRRLELPLQPRTVLVSGENLDIGGLENGHDEAWFEVRADGSVARLGAAPREAKGKVLTAPVATARPAFPRPVVTGAPRPVTPPRPTRPAPAASATADTSANDEGEDEAEEKAPPSVGLRIFGKRPLAAAIEDGWPLTDGTAVVARDGTLGRVRLADGALVDLAENAYPLKPSRCHPVSLTRPSAVGAFGFVCGEPRGTTVIYAYDPLRGRLAEIKRFDRPRIVTSSGNGALAVRGGCAEDADAPVPPSVMPLRLDKSIDLDKSADAGVARAGDAGKKRATAASAGRTHDEQEHDKARGERAGIPPGISEAAPAPDVRPYCILGHDNVWHEIHVRGDVGGERIVVLADGKIVVVSPPAGERTAARLTVLDKGRATTVAITYPKVSPEVARVLRLGLWLDGFEEREPGMVGGWIEAGGSVLGLEVGLDGKARMGQFIRDAGTAFVSGRYGLGWTASHRGFETTDGGMTWRTLDLPEALLTPDKVERRACGPIGCLANGWMRVGWGEPERAPLPQPPAAYHPEKPLWPPRLTLTCEPVAGPPPSAPAPQPAKPKVPTVRSPRYGGPPVLRGFTGVTDLPPFFGQAAPSLHESERGLPAIDVRDLPERYPPMGALGKIYAWGPKSGEWDTLGRWQVKWVSPFAGYGDLHASVPAQAPPVIVDFTRMTTPYGGYSGYWGGYASQFQLVPGDDPSHALLVGRRAMRNEIVLVELEADRAPVELRRADGEPFGEIEGYVRAAGRWFLATPMHGSGTSPATAIWQVDGAVARELVRVPRAGVGEGGRSPAAKLARRSDNRGIGLVVDGQMTAEHATPVRWVLPIDLETGQTGDPEALGYVDLAGLALEACGDDVVGWELDAALSLGGNIPVKLPRGSGSLHSLYGRMRLTSSRACIEKIAGTYDGQSAQRAAQLTRPGASARARPSLRPGEIIATAMSAQTRYALRCALDTRR